MIVEYYKLTKPGIIRGNLIATIAGFLFASRGNIDFILLAAVIFATILVIASGCVFNNYIDRSIDKVMERTKKRALVTGVIPARNALIFGTLLGVLSLVVFLYYTNFLTTRVAIAGFIFYVVMYGYWKRKSVYGTLVGSISGAIPPVIGYTAVTRSFDLGAILLFIVLVCWQMPHFYAIGIYRLREYKAALLPVLPVAKSIALTKKHIAWYVGGFVISTMLLTLFGYTGYLYLIVMTLLGAVWLYKSWQGFEVENSEHWARKMFSFSLLVLLIFCIMISVDFALPF